MQHEIVTNMTDDFHAQTFEFLQYTCVYPFMQSLFSDWKFSRQRQLWVERFFRIITDRCIPDLEGLSAWGVAAFKFTLAGRISLFVTLVKTLVHNIWISTPISTSGSLTGPHDGFSDMKIVSQRLTVASTYDTNLAMGLTLPSGSQWTRA